MLAWISVALLALLLRSAAIAFLTSATSASGVSGAGPGASGTESALLESDLSLDLLAATFFPLAFPALPADLAVAAELLLERAAAVSVARVIASRLAQASAATSAAWRRFVKCFPQIPGELLRLSAHARAPLTRLILPTIWAEKRYRNGITPLVQWHSGAFRGSNGSRVGPQCRRLRRRAHAGSGYLAGGRRNGHCSNRAPGIRRNQQQCRLRVFSMSADSLRREQEPAMGMLSEAFGSAV